MDELEIRLRCIEAAARSPIVHSAGPAVGVREVAAAWFEWIARPPQVSNAKAPLRLPEKK